MTCRFEDNSVWMRRTTSSNASLGSNVSLDLIGISPIARFLRRMRARNLRSWMEVWRDCWTMSRRVVISDSGQLDGVSGR